MSEDHALNTDLFGAALPTLLCAGVIVRCDRNCEDGFCAVDEFLL
jgi:hypothetical protein